MDRIDYCNSLLYGSPVAVVEKLQRVQNNVARLICQQRRCVCARPLLKSLHWLPVEQRIQYKIAVITHKALSTSVPPYIDELQQRQVTTRSLQSTDAPRLSVPWTRTETAKRVAFCVAAPNVRNSLPNDIHNAVNHFFTVAYYTRDERTHRSDTNLEFLTFNTHYNQLQLLDEC